MRASSRSTNRRPPLGLEAVTLVQLTQRNLFPVNAFVYEREAAAAVGGYRAHLPVLGDWDFNLRFVTQFDVDVLPQPLARVHQRPAATAGANANSAPALHRAWDAHLRNAWLRDDLAAGRLGIGLLANLRPLLANHDTLSRRRGRAARCRGPDCRGRRGGHAGRCASGGDLAGRTRTPSLLPGAATGAPTRAARGAGWRRRRRDAGGRRPDAGRVEVVAMATTTRVVRASRGGISWSGRLTRRWRPTPRVCSSPRWRTPRRSVPPSASHPPAHVSGARSSPRPNGWRRGSLATVASNATRRRGRRAAAISG